MKAFTLTKMLAILALSTVGFTLAGAGAASAAPTTAVVTQSSGVVPLSPNGCFTGNFCTYNQGNGGGLCEQMNATGNLSSACANKNDSAFNNRLVQREVVLRKWRDWCLLPARSW